MAVQRQIGRTPKRLDCGKAAPVEIGHHAGAAFTFDQIGMAAHGIGFVGDVEGDHHATPEPVLRAFDRCHDGWDALGKGGVDRIGGNLVILDEIDTGIAEPTDQPCRIFSGQSHIRLDDRTDHQPFGNACQSARAGNTLFWQEVSSAPGGWQGYVFQPKACDLAEIVEIAGNR
ncbi:hypothetical protein D3C71_629180 [compost metagenome]